MDISVSHHYILSIYIVFIDNYIDGTEFLTLTEAEVKAMVPPIGLARKILRLRPQLEPEVYNANYH